MNEDYNKRKDNPGSVDPKLCTYIAVITRTWRDKENWCLEKRKDEFWKDVRSINVDDLVG